jgi:hypothetical protein
MFPWYPTQIQYREVTAYAHTESTQYFHEVDYSASY